MWCTISVGPTSLLCICTFKGNHVGNLYNALGLSCLTSGSIGCYNSCPKLLKGWKMVLCQGGTGEGLGGTFDVWYRISSNFLSRQDSQTQRLIGS